LELQKKKTQQGGEKCTVRGFKTFTVLQTWVITKTSGDKAAMNQVRSV
jgi:hypothetical protein